MLINISDDIAERLKTIAEAQNKTIEDILDMLLQQYQPIQSTFTMADLARNALAANIASSEVVDTADNSREILNTEFADYLKRQNEENDTSG